MKKKVSELTPIEVEQELITFRVDENPKKRFDLVKVLKDIAYFIELMIAFLKFVKK
jgi:hypothetical protein